MFEQGPVKLEDGTWTKIDSLPPMNTRSCWRYGRKCEFYDLCHIYGGDLSKAAALYEEGGRD
jgi:hypothetical protein